MPIYAYRCESCGHSKDILRKMSDPVLTTCPACGADSYRKQVTAAGFQLKGSGWYATDFKGGAKPVTAGADASPSADTAAAGESGGKAEPAGGGASTPAAPAAPATSTKGGEASASGKGSGSASSSGGAAH